MTIKRACNPLGHGTRGLVTANKITRRRLRRNERATVVLSAPPGTRITGFKWSGGVRRADCGFTVELYAVRPGRPRSYIRRESAGRDCPNPRKTTASYRPARPYSIGSATAIVQRVICRSKRGCRASRLNMLVTPLRGGDDLGPGATEGAGGWRWVGERALGARRTGPEFRRRGQRRNREARLFVDGSAVRQGRPLAMQLLPSRSRAPSSGPGNLIFNTARVSGDGPRSNGCTGP